MRIVVLVLALLFFAVPSWATCTTTTANLLQNTIQKAVDKATAGDTICLPAGTQTWATTTAARPSVTLNKGVHASLRDHELHRHARHLCGWHDQLMMAPLRSLVKICSIFTRSECACLRDQFQRSSEPHADSGPQCRMQCNNCRLDHLTP